MRARATGRRAMSRSRGGELRLAATLAAMTAVAAGAVVAAPGRVAALLEASARALRSRRTKRKPVRVYMDGCFDLAHFGHANALRQAKACGDTLVVGLIPDAEVLRCKGPPVLREAERRAVIASVKWVDEIIENVPYDLTPEFCETLYSKHGIDFIVHGDDPCLLPDGTDAYDAPKRAGRFRMIKRTEGVSTTDIVNRVLRAAASDERREKKKTKRDDTSDDDDVAADDDATTSSRHSPQNRFLATTRRIAQFSGGGRAPQPGQRVVYAHGAFDLFNAGHVRLLREAKKMGDFLLVGVHDDQAARRGRGAAYPVLALQERALGVMACRHVDDVIVGAPGEVTRDLIATFDVQTVVAEREDETRTTDDEFQANAASRLLDDAPAGPTRETDDETRSMSHAGSRDPNGLAKTLGLFREVPRLSSHGASGADGLTSSEIVRRVAAARAAYEARNARKNQSEARYYEQKSNRTIELARET
jgi:ethanolamine-phosphate cytidylyltransferase